MDEPQATAEPKRTAHEVFLEHAKVGRIAPQKVVLAAMAEKGVASQSELHPLYGKTVKISTYRGADLFGKPQEVEGGPATIFYAIGDVFHARMANGREPVGSIAAIVTASDGALSYDFPEGA
jgi:hypothetical protein